mmetsp:Transcript_10359/g.30408  ORF Transcript_10359/g.30408 Transcript_10359/m.30408 type:complete len:492 (+) Transcript_10359:54-1529(+)
MVPSVVVVVDPISTGGTVAFEAFKRGFAVIAVWCRELQEDFRSHVPQCCKTEGFKLQAEVEEADSITATAAAVRKAAGDMPIAACIVGGESGVTLADKLSLELGVLSNGIFPGGDRRNKSVQQQAVKAAGLRAVREACGKAWSEVEDFVKSEACPVVVKPVESCGSDGVKLCHTFEEARDHFRLLMESQRKVGAQGAAVLCQEFLKGTEYVVDHVSRNGNHKTVMVWVYDKRPTNGAAFVYWGMIPVDSQSPEAKILIEYTRTVLDALKLDNGPTHGEVMMTASGPCLVEMNCRSHGWDGAWVPLSNLLCGYAQPAVALDSHVQPDKFEELPAVMPSPFKASGQAVMLVSYYSGTVRSAPGYEKMRKLRSFVALQTGYCPGSKVELTVDLFTAVGVLMLANTDKRQLEQDLAEVRSMEKDGIFEFDEEVDPALYQPTPDTVAFADRRRASSNMSNESLVGKRAAAPPPLLTMAAVFAAGIIVGLGLSKRFR